MHIRLIVEDSSMENKCDENNIISLTCPSARFLSSSFCRACSSAIRCSIACNDSRVNGRNTLFSSMYESESMDMF